jgi:predicted nucleic acid-binding protein
VIVIDANVAIKWAIEQPLRERALAILAHSVALVAPAMFVGEVTTAVWQYVRAGQISGEQAREGLLLIMNQVSIFEDDAVLAEEALSIGIELKYAPYDCFYLVSAIRRRVPLVTADRRLVNRLATTAYKSHVVHLADWT